MTSVSKVDSYHQATRPLMSFVHGQEYRPGHVWSTDDLLSVTPDILVRYIKMKVYGSENAQPDIDPPLYYRSNSVAYWKKAWSYFMPNQITPWNEIAAVGNPTRSTAVNKILKAIKKMEVATVKLKKESKKPFWKFW